MGSPVILALELPEQLVRMVEVPDLELVQEPLDLLDHCLRLPVALGVIGPGVDWLRTHIPAQLAPGLAVHLPAVREDLAEPSGLLHCVPEGVSCILLVGFGVRPAGGQQPGGVIH